MRRLLMLMTLAAVAAGCRTTTPAAQPCCRPAYNQCNPCGTTTMGTTMGTPTMSGPTMETYGTPTFQSGPTVVTPGPTTYAPTTPN